MTAPLTVPDGYTVTLNEVTTRDEWGITAEVRHPDGTFTGCDFYGPYCHGWHRQTSAAMRCGIRQARSAARS